MNRETLNNNIEYRLNDAIKEDHKNEIFSLSIFEKSESIKYLCSVGHRQITIYIFNGKLIPTLVYIDSEPEERFYCCCWSDKLVNGNVQLAFGGQKGLIRILEFNPDEILTINQEKISLKEHLKTLVGHGGSINDLKFHKIEHHILLSASKDHSLRLWNISNGYCIAIFGGLNGHRDEVLYSDFHIKHQKFVSGGLDHYIKIWSLENINMNINNKKCQLVVFPTFSTREIHSNYVDCVKWIGDLLVSKSCDESIIVWSIKNIRASKSKIYPLAKFCIKSCNIWFLKFDFNWDQKIIACGNLEGKILLWTIDPNKEFSTKPIYLSTSKCKSVVRSVVFDKNGNNLFAVCDDSTIWNWTLSK